jgi:L-seryl-tRNA(Ser) seleniumtransferase
MRALRVDKMTYAALAATLELWGRAPARREIPVYRMLTLSAAELGARASALLAALKSIDAIECRVIDGASTTGGGSAPDSALPSTLVSLRHPTLNATDLESRLRAGAPPLIARIQDDAVLIDLRTVDPADDAAVAKAIRAAFDATT